MRVVTVQYRVSFGGSEETFRSARADVLPDGSLAVNHVDGKTYICADAWLFCTEAQA